MTAFAPATPAAAFVAAVLSHTMKNVVTIVGGVGSMLSFNVSLTATVEESAEVRDREHELADSK